MRKVFDSRYWRPHDQKVPVAGWKISPGIFLKRRTRLPTARKPCCSFQETLVLDYTGCRRTRLPQSRWEGSAAQFLKSAIPACAGFESYLKRRKSKWTRKNWSDISNFCWPKGRSCWQRPGEGKLLPLLQDICTVIPLTRPVPQARPQCRSACKRLIAGSCAPSRTPLGGSREGPTAFARCARNRSPKRA